MCEVPNAINRVDEPEPDDIKSSELGELIACTCEGLDNAIKKGVDSMIQENASVDLISDYIQKMKYGDWIECNCDANKTG